MLAKIWEKETWTGVTRQIMIDKAKVEWVEGNVFSLQGTGGRSVSDASTCLMFMSLLRWISRAWRFASFQCHAGSCSMSKTKNTRRQMTGFMPLPGGHGMPYQDLLGEYDGVCFQLYWILTVTISKCQILVTMEVWLGIELHRPQTWDSTPLKCSTVCWYCWPMCAF